MQIVCILKYSHKWKITRQQLLRGPQRRCRGNYGRWSKMGRDGRSRRGNDGGWDDARWQTGKLSSRTQLFGIFLSTIEPPIESLCSEPLTIPVYTFAEQVRGRLDIWADRHGRPSRYVRQSRRRCEMVKSAITINQNKLILLISSK